MSDVTLTNKARELFLQSQGIKAKGILTSDTQYRNMFNETLKLMEKADKYALKKMSKKVDNIQKKIIANSAELLEYEKFRRVYK